MNYITNLSQLYVNDAKQLASAIQTFPRFSQSDVGITKVALAIFRFTFTTSLALSACTFAMALGSVGITATVMAAAGLVFKFVLTHDFAWICYKFEKLITAEKDTTKEFNAQQIENFLINDTIIAKTIMDYAKQAFQVFSPA